jgi:hypothetical protein
VESYHPEAILSFRHRHQWLSGKKVAIDVRVGHVQKLGWKGRVGSHSCGCQRKDGPAAHIKMVALIACWGGIQGGLRRCEDENERVGEVD